MQRTESRSRSQERSLQASSQKNSQKNSQRNSKTSSMKGQQKGQQKSSQNNQYYPQQKGQKRSEDIILLHQIVQDLFREKRITIFSYLKALEEERQISYFSFQQFIEYIQQPKESISQQFCELFAKDFEKHKTIYGEQKWVFPHINLRIDPQLEKTLKIHFLRRYVLENNKKCNSIHAQVLQNKEHQKDADSSFQSSCSDEDQIYDIEQGESLIKNTQSFQKKPKPKPTVITENKQQKQTLQRRVNFACKQAQMFIPQFFFFTRSGEERVSINYILSIDTTALFEKYLNQVTTQISKQLKMNQFIKKSLKQFYEEYGLYNSIINNQSFNQDENNLKLLSYYRMRYMKKQNTKVYLFKQNQSPLLNFWNHIYQQAIILGQQYSQNVKNSLQKMLKKIHLIFQPKSQFYALTEIKQIIVVNIYVPNFELFDSFTKNILKPYLMVCIYQKLGHNLVRCNEQFIMGPLNESFTFKNNTVGCKILQIIYENAKDIKNFFKKHQFNHNILDRTSNIDKINRIVQQGRTFLLTYKYVFDEMKKSLTDFINIKKIISALKSVDKISNIKEIKQASMQLWQLFKNLDPQLSVQTKKEKISTNQIEKQKLAFIHALILMKFVSKLPSKKNSIYSQNVRLLFQQEAPFSPNIMQKINILIIQIKKKQKTFFQDQQVAIISEFYLQNSKPFNILQQKVNNLASKFKGLNFFDFLENAAAIFQIEYKRLQIDQIKQISKDTIKQLSRIDLIRKTYNKLAKFLKYSDIYIISCSVPSFIFQKIQLQSGFQIEAKLYPTLYKNKYLYGQDYQIMKKINQNNTLLVGRIPLKSSEEKIRVFMGRPREDQVPFIYLSGKRCGWRLHTQEEQEEVEEEE